MFILSQLGTCHWRTSKMKEIKKYNSHLTSDCIETWDDTRKLLILEETSLNCAYCHTISKRLHYL